MKIIFWQNIISMHQVSFLKKLADRHDVYLFVENKLDDDRKAQGWEAPDTGNVKVAKVNIQNYINILSEHAEGYHFFSGLYAYPIITAALKEAIKLKLFIGIIAEPQNWMGSKGVWNKIKTVNFFNRYSQGIDLILAIGSKGPWWYKKCGFPSDKIFEWGYCVQKPQKIELSSSIKKYDKPRLLFVGRLIKMKGLFELLEVLNNYYSNEFSQLNIIGTGADRRRLENYVGKSKIKNKVEFKGQCQHSEIWNEYANADFLILPSKRKEGWGAVVNEALLSGVPIILSEYCGASVLVNDNNGYIFNINKKPFLKEIVGDALGDKEIYSSDNKELIGIEANKTISSQSYVKYFEDILLSITRGETSKVVAPWRTN